MDITTQTFNTNTTASLQQESWYQHLDFKCDIFKILKKNRKQYLLAASVSEQGNMLENYTPATLTHQLTSCVFADGWRVNGITSSHHLLADTPHCSQILKYTSDTQTMEQNITLDVLICQRWLKNLLNVQFGPCERFGVHHCKLHQ